MGILEDVKTGGVISTLVKKVSIFETWMREHNAKYHSPGGGVSANDGWEEVSDTWTYATANTINVPSGATALYKNGMGIRWKQGGSYKYAYVTVVASSLLTVTGGSDYTVANSAITDVAYTFSPQTAIGFPNTFNYTCTPSGTSGGTMTTSKFSVSGNRMKFRILYTLGGITGGVSFTLPGTSVGFPSFTVWFQDTGTNTYPGVGFVSGSTITVYAVNTSLSDAVVRSLTSLIPFTWAANDFISVEGEFEYAS